MMEHISPSNEANAPGEPLASCLIATVPRSGSWLLATRLQSTGLAGHPEEYFRPDHRAFWLEEWGSAAIPDFRSYVRRAVRYGTTDNGVFSAKLHWYQFEWLLGQLRDRPECKTFSDHQLIEQNFPPPRYVYLTRGDKPRQAVSYYRAIHTDEWFVLPGDGSPRHRAKPVSDPDFQQIRWLEDLVTEHELRWEQYFDAAGLEPLRLSYEQLCSDPHGTIAQVLNLLAVDRDSRDVIAASGLVRQADRATEECLQSYLEIRETLLPKSEAVRWFSREKRFKLVGRAAASAGALGARGG